MALQPLFISDWKHLSAYADVIVTRNVKDFSFSEIPGYDSRRIHLQGKHNIVLS